MHKFCQFRIFWHHLIFLLQERGLDVGAQASWLASSFNETAKEFYNKTTEVSRRLALWGPLGSYLEGVAEVFETSTSLNLSEEKLLNEGFDWLLPACRVSELNSALGFLQIVLAQLRWDSLFKYSPAPRNHLLFLSFSHSSLSLIGTPSQIADTFRQMFSSRGQAKLLLKSDKWLQQRRLISSALPNPA